MSVRLDQLLNLPELKNLKLVSGIKGLDKRVKWVHVIESPDDVLDHVQKNELIIVTGVRILNNKDDFIELIKKLIVTKAAGLVVNVGKYIDKVPLEAKSISDENDFPVFEFPWELSLAGLTKTICADILKEES